MIHSEFGKVNIVGPASFVIADFVMICEEIVEVLMENVGITRDEAKAEAIKWAIKGVEFNDDKENKGNDKDDDLPDKALDAIGSIIDMIKEAINDEADD